MNNRQKAKHFKRLYEMGLPKKPYPVVFEHIDLKHYKTQTVTERWDEVPMYIIEDKLVQNIREILKENIKAEHDIYDRNVYSLDIWMER
jgi:predicted class III extradiol MEMO1 family dioxygenase